jgi:hypothetical protein
MNVFVDIGYNTYNIVITLLALYSHGYFQVQIRHLAQTPYRNSFGSSHTHPTESAHKWP